MNAVNTTVDKNDIRLFASPLDGNISAHFNALLL